MFVLTCPTGCAILFYGATILSGRESCGMAIHSYQLPLTWCGTADYCKWSVFKSCGQANPGLCYWHCCLFM